MGLLLSLSIVILIRNIQGQSNINLDEFLNSIQNPLNTVGDLHPDTGLNISQFLEKYGYPLEYHEVETEDGFFIMMHRIPHGSDKTNEDAADKPAVLLVHGLMCSSMDWVYLGPSSSLALLLADQGYDVWLVSTRGTTPSMKHRTLNSSEAEFWDFSWHEKGYYDLPACIDHITTNTSRKTVTLIGHSEGTTDSLVLTSSKPEYNEKINLMVLLSPIAYMDGVISPIIMLMVKYMEELQLMFNTFGIHGISYSPAILQIGETYCSDGSAFQEICANFLELLCGYDFPQLNKTFLTVLMSNTPAGMSTKELIHYGQEIRSGYFRQYDYGVLSNIVRYGNKFPPKYDVSKITAPVAAYYSQNDYFASMDDVNKLLNELPNVVENHIIEYAQFNHLDFIIAIDVKTLLYDTVISTIEKYNPLNK